MLPPVLPPVLCFRPSYDQLIQQLGIRSVVAAETGGRRAYPTPNK
jgi:hypothetical protein